MAPEVEDGKVPLDRLTNKCDVYSLGKLLYWLFAGKIFNREKHREPHWDLKRECDDIKTETRMEYVNRLLDKMIVERSGGRIDVGDVLEELSKLIKIFERNYNVIGKDIPQHCIYCGIGEYRKPARNKAQAQQQYSLGPTVNADKEWRAFACDYCGNVQTFRVDLCENKDWLD